MDLDQIKELMAAMKRFGLTRVLLKGKNGFEIQLEKTESKPQDSVFRKEELPREIAQPIFHAPESHRAHLPVEKELPKAGVFVTSPMVGTFYRSASPSDPAFVKVGDSVNENSVVCIIEAMKVMNEVKAQKSGKIAEILIENMQPVEFGTKLFRIE